jgi:hypothetical protein
VAPDLVQQRRAAGERVVGLVHATSPGEARTARRIASRGKEVAGGLLGYAIQVSAGRSRAIAASSALVEREVVAQRHAHVAHAGGDRAHAVHHERGSARARTAPGSRARADDLQDLVGAVAEQDLERSGMPIASRRRRLQPRRRRIGIAVHRDLREALAHLARELAGSGTGFSIASSFTMPCGGRTW